MFIDWSRGILLTAMCGRDQPMNFRHGLRHAICEYMHATKDHTPSFMPRGLSRREAAYYVGVSPSFFDILVGDGRMPAPKKVNSRVLWDRVSLDAAFEALPDVDSQNRNPWDEGD